MRKGYISLHRSIKDNWLWQEKPFTKGQAWVDMLLNTNYETGKFKLNSKYVTVKRGELCRSENTLAETWGWSRGKVRRFLKMLENERQIVQDTVQGISVIRICKYNDYQKNGTAHSTADGTADGTHSNKNINKNINKGIVKNRKLASPEKIYSVRELLRSKGLKV